MKKKIIIISFIIITAIALIVVAISSNRCSLYINGVNRGTFIEVNSYTCTYLAESCKKFIDEGYACNLNKNPISLRDYECTCQIRYGEFDK